MLLAACSKAGFAQEDSTKQKEGSDTIRVGSIIIVNKGDHNYDVSNDNRYQKRSYKKSNITTNWLIFDIGYSGFADKTDYSSAEAQSFLQNPQNGPLYEGDFSTKGIGISNFSLWFFMQKLNVYKHVVNLKYGFGIENINDRKTKFTCNPFGRESIGYRRINPIVNQIVGFGQCIA